MAKLKTARFDPREVLGGDVPTNGAAAVFEGQAPYTVEFTIQGVCPLLFHAWNCEAVEAKGGAAKGSKAKKTDDVESYVHRTTDGFLGIPGEYVRMGMVNAAKFKQDPRSPRKSAMDLFRAALVTQTEIASLGVKDWDYLDKRRVVVQRNGITRTRPAMLAGWRASFTMEVVLPEYVTPDLLHEVLALAGRIIGLADFRPSYGRFQVVEYTVRQ